MKSELLSNIQGISPPPPPIGRTWFHETEICLTQSSPIAMNAKSHLRGEQKVDEYYFLDKFSKFSVFLM